LAMARSARASVRGQREKPGPRSPACRGSAYPAPRDSLALPASSGKRLLPRDTYDSVAVAHNGKGLEARIAADSGPSLGDSSRRAFRPSETFAVRWPRVSAPTGRSAMTGFSVPTACRFDLIRNASGFAFCLGYTKAPLQTV
jgi:hypothetical protein